jgi:hypothetical protein
MSSNSSNNNSKNDTPITNNCTHVSNEILNAFSQEPLTIEYPKSNLSMESNFNGSLGMPLEESSTSSPCSEEEPWEKHASGFEDSLKKLANIDDITSAPESQVIKPVKKTADEHVNRIMMTLNLLSTQNDDHVHIDESHFFKVPKDSKKKRCYKKFR